MRPREGHPPPPTRGQAPPKALRQRSILSPRAEGGKPLGERPHSHVRAVAREHACAFLPPAGHTPARSPVAPALARSPAGPTAARALSTFIHPPPPLCSTRAHPCQTGGHAGAAHPKPWRPTSTQAITRSGTTTAPFLETPSHSRAQSPALPPKGRSLSLSLPVFQSPNLSLSFPVLPMVSTGTVPGRQRTFPTVLIYLWGRTATPRSSKPHSATLQDTLPIVYLRGSRHRQEQNAAGLSVGLDSADENLPGVLSV